MRRHVFYACLTMALAVPVFPGVAHADDAVGTSAYFGGASVNSRITVPYSTTLNPGPQDVSATVEINTTAMPGTGAPSGRPTQYEYLRFNRRRVMIRRPSPEIRTESTWRRTR